MIMTATASPGETGTYVYGIFPGDIELTGERDGVGDPPGRIRVVRSGDLAALVSDVDPARPLGSPADLRTHKEIIDGSAAGAAVLPMRFGAVLSSDDAVAGELLDAHHEEFASALEQLDGRVQYVIRGRYEERALLEEILAENGQAAALRDQIRGADPDLTRSERIRLGEIISLAVEARREQDTDVLLQAMDGYCAASAVREATHEQDAVNVAFLVDAGQEDSLAALVEDLEDAWRGRVRLRVLGPMAAYDFVGSPAAGAPA